MNAVISAVCLYSNGVRVWTLFFYFFTVRCICGHSPAEKSVSRSPVSLCARVQLSLTLSVSFNRLTRVWALRLKRTAYSNCCPFIFYNWLRWFFIFYFLRLLFCLKFLLVSLSLHICSCSFCCSQLEKTHFAELNGSHCRAWVNLTQVKSSFLHNVKDEMYLHI